ncbi:MAG: hypothetical protein WA634_09035 [Silvibacterium sp.]
MPNNQWWEGPLEYVRISPDGNWALVNRTGSQSGVQLYSLKTGQEDHFTLMADLNRVDNAAFCGPHGTSPAASCRCGVLTAAESAIFSEACV